MSDETPGGYPEGWGWPDNARKAHYFSGPVSSLFGGRYSACGRFNYDGLLSLGEQRDQDTCAHCRKALAKRPAVEAAS